jgi:adenylosuccinate lyase
MPDPHAALTALSPLDGRYAAKVAPLAEHFSEFGLIRARVRIEIAWLIALSAMASPRLPLRRRRPWRLPRPQNRSRPPMRRVKVIERTTNHDVKAVGYG